ncbi:MAG: S66 peptidase family protein [Lachnospiraceae bacterium]
MKYPKFLPPNGTIGFVAPSFGCNIEPYHTAFDHAQEKFRALGHSIELGPNSYAGCGIGISNTPEVCGKELTEYYCNDTSDILISCGGGELMCETMSEVDFEKIKTAEPKWFMGYSDNTNMTFLLATLCDTASIYGPCAAAFGMEPWHQSLQDAYDLLSGKTRTVHGYDGWEKESLKDEEHPLVPYNITEKRELHVYQPDGTEDTQKKVTLNGRLLGGCLDCLGNLVGTKFDAVSDFKERYKEDGVLWFLESCDLNVMAIRRTLWQLKNAGWFDTASGFLIGRPLCFGEEFLGLDQYHAVVDILSDLHVPIVMDTDIGHLAPMMPLVCGSLADVKVDGNEIAVDMKFQ